LGGWIHSGVEGGVNFIAMASLRRNRRSGPGDKATGKEGKLGVAWLGAVADVNANQASPTMGNDGACTRR